MSVTLRPDFPNADSVNSATAESASADPRPPDSDGSAVPASAVPGAGTSFHFDQGWALYKLEPDLMLIEVAHTAPKEIGVDEFNDFMQGYIAARRQREEYFKEAQPARSENVSSALSNACEQDEGA